MKIYPNPSHSVSYISVPSELKSGGRLTVTNNNGEMIYHQSFAQSNSQLIPLDLTEHPNGIYKITLGNEAQEVSYDFLNLAKINCPALI